MIADKKALLLDMNGTFMFGEDRFGDDEDFSCYYHQHGGQLDSELINALIRTTYHDLSVKYPLKEYRYSFPDLAKTIAHFLDIPLPRCEIEKIIDTFSYHEHGFIPDDYRLVIQKLASKYKLAVVIDIWAPKQRWLDSFQQHGLDKLISASSFSSDHGIVKPAPEPFEQVVKALEMTKQDCLVIGDSVRRDLGGAISAGIDCVLVGGATDKRALASFPDLPTFCQAIKF